MSAAADDEDAQRRDDELSVLTSIFESDVACEAFDDGRSQITRDFEDCRVVVTLLKEIDIIIDNAESDIDQITAGLQRTGREQLTLIILRAPPSLPSEKKEVSRETMRGLGLLIREQTKNLQQLYMCGVKCRDEEDLIDLVECCRHVETVKYIQ